MKKITKNISVIFMMAVAFAAFGCRHNTGTDEPNSKPVTPENPISEEKIEAVAFSIASGEVEEYSTVTLSTPTADATIYYLLVKGDDTATLTVENYKTAEQYAEPIEIAENVTIYAIAAKGEKVSEITSAAYTTVAPADAMRNWTEESTATAYSVYKYADLEKLAEVVNDGNALAGVTITQKANIKINEAVLGEKFAEPEEASAGEPNADLINFAGIGSRKIPFSGTYDGNKKVISGLYIYGDHQGLGFIGCIKNATVKNVIIVDACVVNSNKSGKEDGSDDDRFGGIIGITFEGECTNTVENCVFVGTVGSEVAEERGGAYEYIGGIVGRVEKNSTADIKNCFSITKINGSGAAIATKKDKSTANFENSYGVSLDGKVYKTKDAEIEALDEEGGVTKAEIIEAAKTACGIDLTDYFTKAGL